MPDDVVHVAGDAQPLLGDRPGGVQCGELGGAPAPATSTRASAHVPVMTAML